MHMKNSKVIFLLIKLIIIKLNKLFLNKLLAWKIKLQLI